MSNDRLLTCLTAARDRAVERRRSILVSVSRVIAGTPDPVALFAANRDRFAPASLWIATETGFAIVGLGCAHEIQACGPDRFDFASGRWDELLEGAIVAGPRAPTLFGGFAFDPDRPGTMLWRTFPNSALVLPRVAITEQKHETTITFNAVVAPDSDPASLCGELNALWREAAERCTHYVRREPPVGVLACEDVLPSDDWKDLVRQAVTAIKRGRLEKVVLAREIVARSPQPLAIGRALVRLRDRYPGAYLFAISRNGSCFLGATPERLVSLDKAVVRATGLAGTAPRGGDSVEDERLGRDLLTSGKDRHEHGLVVDTLREALQPFCATLTVPSEPVLVKLARLQHLFTPVSGKARPGVNMFDLVKTTHPTPAVGGLPRAPALAHIRDHEQLDRGWFAGPVGWIDSSGEGEFAVALRSALVERDRAMLFAGCGIVADSDPDSEYQETCLKLRTMLFTLGLEPSAMDEERLVA